MPPAVTAFATWVASYFGGSALVAYAVEAAVYYAAGRFFYRRDDQGRGRGSIPLNSRLQYLREPDAPHRIIYGEATMAPTIVADFSDDHNLYLLTALCPHDIEDIVSVRVNDQDFFPPAEVDDFNNGLLYTHPLVGPDRVNMLVVSNHSAYDTISALRKQVGTNSRRNSVPIMAVVVDKEARASGELGKTGRDVTYGLGGNWVQHGSNNLDDGRRFGPFMFGTDGKGKTPGDLGMKMSGMSWMVLVFPRSLRVVSGSTDPDVWNSVPRVTLRMRRSNSTLKLPNGFNRAPYSRGNSALCAYDYLARYTDYGTRICGFDRIDASNLMAAAQFCEDRGLTSNGVITLDQAPADVMEQLGFAMNAGVFTEAAGIRKILPGAPSTATRVITDDHIVENSWAYSPMVDVNSRVSEFVCRYVDVDGVEQSAGASYPDSVVTSTQELQLDLINNREQAEAVARIMLSRIWNGASLSFSLLDPMTPIRPYDKIHVRGGGPLELDDVFRVLRIERTTDGRLVVQCIFEDDDLFDAQAPSSTYIPPARPPNYTGTGADDTFRVIVHEDGGVLKVRTPGASEDTIIDYR